MPAVKSHPQRERTNTHHGLQSLEIISYSTPSTGRLQLSPHGQLGAIDFVELLWRTLAHKLLPRARSAQVTLLHENVQPVQVRHALVFP